MRAALLASFLLVIPASARAECGSVPECMLRLGTFRLDARMAAIAAAVATPVIIAGAIASAARMKLERPMPEGVIPGEPGKPAHLSLIPTPGPVLAPGAREEAPPPSGAFRFNDTATNVALAIGGAALITSIIVGVLQHR